MASKTKAEESVDAAVAEVTDKMTRVGFGDMEYTFKSKRLNALQFRLPMQKGKDAVAVEFLLGPVQFMKFMDANADADGCTPDETFYEFISAIGSAVGSGNS